MSATNGKPPIEVAFALKQASIVTASTGEDDRWTAGLARRRAC
jgi:hypothetical protein